MVAFGKPSVRSIAWIFALASFAGQPACAQETWLMPRDPRVRMQFTLSHAKALEVIESLREAHPHLEFLPGHGDGYFVVRASRKELLNVKRELANLDRPLERAVEPITEAVAVKYGDVVSVSQVLESLVPEATYKVDQKLNLIVVTGSPGAVDQVRELLADRPDNIDQVLVDLRLLELTSTGVGSLLSDLQRTTLRGSKRELVNGVELGDSCPDTDFWIGQDDD